MRHHPREDGPLLEALPLHLVREAVRGELQRDGLHVVLVREVERDEDDGHGAFNRHGDCGARVGQEWGQ